MKKFSDYIKEETDSEVQAKIEKEKKIKDDFKNLATNSKMEELNNKEKGSKS